MELLSVSKTDKDEGVRKQSMVKGSDAKAKAQGRDDDENVSSAEMIVIKPKTAKECGDCRSSAARVQLQSSVETAKAGSSCL